MQTILGAGGTIGEILAKELSRYTSNIRLASRNPQKVNLTDQLFPADLTHRNNIFKAVEGSEIVYVTIGFPYKTSDWEKLWNPFIHNVVSACILYRAKLVFLDNIYMYDPTHIGHMTEDTPIYPSSAKGKIRANVAKKVVELFDNNRCDALIGRAPDFLSSRNSIIGELIYKTLKKGKKAICLYCSNKKHNIIHPSDIAKSLALLGNTASAYNQVWHLPTTKQALTGKQWVEIFANELNCKPRYLILSEPLINALGLFIPMLKEISEIKYQYNQDYYFDSSKFERSFNYQPLTVNEAVKLVIEEDQILNK